MYSTELKAQWKLDVNGRVKNEDTGKRFEGVTITIKRNGAVWKTITSPSNGEFILELPPDAVYLVEFSKSGFTTKRIEFSTKNVPAEDAKYGFGFPMEISLFEEVEGLDVSILNQPIAKVAFDPLYGDMNYDPNYTKSIQKELDKLKKEHEQKRKEQEAARKAKEKEYASAIASADKLFNSKKYAEAKPLYEQAAKLLPNESYPQFQLGLIADELAAANEANSRYTSAIERGDKAFAERNWEKAKMEYNAAINYKPNEVYPQNKLKEIDNLIKNKEKIDKEYNDLITSADAYMINKNYEKAKIDFEKAAALKDFE
ncbi:MAG: carboxypeptidase-like regulatory domain-containing protein, partial [Vicingaceae bacterium]|nr:carboxypeptidase-like regulatory domain-containing protein [Vicingaceae bacterium]